MFLLRRCTKFCDNWKGCKGNIYCHKVGSSEEMFLNQSKGETEDNGGMQQNSQTNFFTGKDKSLYP